MSNRLSQVPAKGFPDLRCSQVHSCQSTHADSLWSACGLQEIDCGFRNLSSLGLLFGFQRPSRLCPTATSCYPVAFLFTISKRSCCQAAVAASLFRFVPRRPALRFGGARNLLPFRPPCQLSSLTLCFLSTALLPQQLGCFSGEAASTTAASRVNFVSLTAYLVVLLLRPGLFHRQCDVAFPSGGAPSTAARPVESTAFLHFFFPAQRNVARATCRRSGDAASITAAFGVNTASLTPYFLFRAPPPNSGFSKTGMFADSSSRGAGPRLSSDRAHFEEGHPA